MDPGDGTRAKRQGADTRIPKRTPNACRRCKKRKVKCSGEQPCSNCKSGSQECIFDQTDRRLVISQSHLRNLQSRLSAYEATVGTRQSAGSPLQPQSGNLHNSTPNLPASTSASRASVPEVSGYPAASETAFSLLQEGSAVSVDSQTTSPPLHDIVNPLTASPSRFAKDPHGKERYLGHSSTWSFSFQVRNLIRSCTTNFDLHDETPGVEGAAYGMSLALEKEGAMRYDVDIPSHEYVEHLTTTAHFHLGAVYHFFEKESFLQDLRVFYSSKDFETSGLTQLWKLKLFLIIAFGKLFLGRQGNEFGPPGADYCVAAVNRMPPLIILFREPTLAIEVLCLAALYLQSADMRNAAYIYIGHALRIALAQGWNRQIDALLLEPAQYQHRLKLWWTVYILDGKLSTLMGVPLALNDSDDINVLLPSSLDESFPLSTQALALNISLSRLLRKVMATVYRLNGRLDKSFLQGVQDVLAIMSTLKGELHEKVPLGLIGGLGSISRTASTLHLAYHQCAILTTRPVIYFLVQKRVEFLATGASLKEVSDPVRALVDICVESASTSLMILSTLHEQELIELFLPFDSEATFSSELIIILAELIGFDSATYQRWHDTADYILRNMASRGSMPAISYEMELNELRNMAKDLDREASDFNTFDFGHIGQDQLMSGWVGSLDQQNPDFGNAVPGAMRLINNELFSTIDSNLLEDEWFWAQS